MDRRSFLASLSAALGAFFLGPRISAAQRKPNSSKNRLMPTLQAHGLAAYNTPSASLTVTSGGSNSLLAVWIAIDGTDPTTITYNGNSVTEKGRWQWVAAAPNNGHRTTAVYWITSPVASATLTVATSTNSFIVGWASFSGVHQTSPVRWPFEYTSTLRSAGIGIGPASSQGTVNAYVSSSDLIYGMVAGSKAGGGITAFGSPNGTTTQLDTAVNDTAPTYYLAAVHGTTPGTNDDAFNFYWNLTASGTDYSASVLVLRSDTDVLPTAGATYGWGYVASGFQQLPFGDSYARRADPLALSARLKGASTSAFDTFIGIGVGADGHPYVWGDPTYGIRGDGTTGGAAMVSPTQVSALTGCTDVAAGTGTVFAICAGMLKGWGANFSGELGNSTTTQQTTPLTLTLPMGAGTPVQVSAGDGWVLVRDDSGNVYHSGDNSFGQRGTVGVGGYTTFGQVTLAHPAIDISAGGSHALAVLSNADAVSWGRNFSGECGVGNTTSPQAPSTMSGLGGVAVQVSGLFRRSMVLTTGPAIYISGINPIPGGLSITTPTTLGLSGSVPTSLGRRSPQGADWLWTTTAKQLFGVGLDANYELDAFGPYPGPSVNGFGNQPVTTSERLLSDRFTSPANWVHPVGLGYGVITDVARRSRAWAFVLG